MMKYIFAITLLFCSLLILAQSKGSPEEKAKYLSETILKQDLSLNEEQLEKIYEANLEMFNNILKEESSGGSMREIRNFMLERNKKLKVILTSNQYQKFESNMMEYQEMLDKKFNR